VHSATLAHCDYPPSSLCLDGVNGPSACDVLGGCSLLFVVVAGLLLARYCNDAVGWLVCTLSGFARADTSCVWCTQQGETSTIALFCWSSPELSWRAVGGCEEETSGEAATSFRLSGLTWHTRREGLSMPRLAADRNDVAVLRVGRFFFLRFCELCRCGFCSSFSFLYCSSLEVGIALASENFAAAFPLLHFRVSTRPRFPPRPRLGCLVQAQSSRNVRNGRSHPAAWLCTVATNTLHEVLTGLVWVPEGRELRLPRRRRWRSRRRPH